VVKVQQATVDAYLEDIVSSAIDRTANAQARQDVQQMATIINDAAYEAEQRSLLMSCHCYNTVSVYLCVLWSVEAYHTVLFDALLHTTVYINVIFVN